MEKKLEVKNLIISFRTQGGKVQAVRNINFDLYKGETLAIVGESGSGKSVTNRAVIGILAGNAIVEGGEIIYDGQDLLKISEDEFHKIRGDKIAMIFQDPMSSLNPIMKVGKQLTEAMLLKSSSGRKNARRNFNGKLKLLNATMNEVASGNEEQIQYNVESCKTFDSFCINSTKLESAYNEIRRRTVELELDVQDVLFLISKNQKIEVGKTLKHVLAALPATLHPDIVVMDERLTADMAVLKEELAVKEAETLSEKAQKALEDIDEILNAAISRPGPNYFTLGYYMMKNPEAQLDDMPLDELTTMTREFLDEDFMLKFIEEGAKAMALSHEKSIAAKVALLPELDKLEELFSAEELNKKQCLAAIKAVSAKVKGAINNLLVHKNSTEFVFESSLTDAVNKYFFGIVNNPKEIARFEKQSEKYQKALDKGKTPDYKIIPAALVDLELAKENIRKVIRGLADNYVNQIANADQFDAKAQMVDLIDYLKEQASAVVQKITPKMAKAKALNLLKEVGIPEPAIRYNQYPFEFSGGMRQRIVIAIALAANPDILICDEPTTALDVTIQSQILELINRIKAERNLSVIFITHDLGVVANMADRIAVMYAGKIVEYGTADDVFYDPRHPYTWALLSSMPDLDTKEKLEAIPGTPPNMIYPPQGDAFAARNKYALEIDFEQQPPMFQVSDTHYAATWLLHPNAPHVDPPRIVTDRIERMSKKEQEVK